MKNGLKAYFKHGQTTLSLVVAFMAQIIFIICWMTAYNGVYDRTDNLKLAVVNEAGEFGDAMVQQFQSSLPFQVLKLNKEDALKDLELRKVHLVVDIPQNFGEALQTPGVNAEINYTVNQSNPQVTKSIVDTLTTRLTAQLNQNAALEGTQVVLKQLNMPDEQLESTAQGLLNKVVANTQSLHPVDGMKNQMVPMMLVLGSFVGAMLMAMNVHQVSMLVGNSITKKEHFAVRTFIILVGALVISIIGSSLIYLLGGQMEVGFGSYWLFHFLILLTFMYFAQMFLLIFGMAGMFVNMVMLSLQLVTSGTIVPREMLSSFFQHLGTFLPATYAVNGLFNLGFGGIETVKDVEVLLLILVCSIVISVALIMVKKLSTVETAERIQIEEALMH